MAVVEAAPYKGEEHQEAAPHSQEIERKFFITSLPENLDEFPSVPIRQGYLSITPETETRLRQAGDRYFKTTKSASALVRTEEEVEITKDDFEKDWPFTDGKRLEKIRYKIPDTTTGVTYEIDIYSGDLKEMPPTVEVEFQGEKDADAFSVPVWFGTELTGKSEYQNSALATKGIPKDIDTVLGTGEKKKDEVVIEKSLQKDISQLVDLVIEKKNTLDRPLVLGLAGRTSSGKSTVIGPLTKRAEELGMRVVALPMDDYSLGNAHIARLADVGITINWDHPLYMDFEKIRSDVETLKKGERIEKPTFSFITGERDVSEPFDSGDIIIVEGLFANRPELQDILDVKAFIDISLHGSILRRLMRDVQRTTMDPSQILRYYLQVVEPMYQEHIVQTRDTADVVLVNEYNPQNEAEKAGMYEAQTKFKMTYDTEKLRRAGAELLGVVTQQDYYFTPKDKNLTDSGESLRIRKEGGVSLLSYKGPELGEKVRVRPKFEFEIDDSIEGSLIEKYGDTVQEIIKTRRIYTLADTIVTVDTVGKKDGEDFRPLGTFLEIRCDRGKYEEQLKIICEKLGLNPAERINASYTAL